MLVEIRQGADSEAIFTKAQTYKLKEVITELSDVYVDLKVFYLKNNLHKKPNKFSEKYLMNCHCINWLYTLRCEYGQGGIKFIEKTLWALKHTLERNLDDVQFEYVKLMISILLEVRTLYL